MYKVTIEKIEEIRTEERSWVVVGQEIKVEEQSQQSISRILGGRGDAEPKIVLSPSDLYDYKMIEKTKTVTTQLYEQSFDQLDIRKAVLSLLEASYPKDIRGDSL